MGLVAEFAVFFKPFLASLEIGVSIKWKLSHDTKRIMAKIMASVTNVFRFINCCSCIMRLITRT